MENRLTVYHQPPMAGVSSGQLLAAWCHRRELLEAIRAELLRRGMMSEENPEAAGPIRLNYHGPQEAA